MLNNKKVCHISTLHSADDERIFFKQCRSLANSYNVYFIVPSKQSYVQDNVHIISIPRFSNRFLHFSINNLIISYLVLVKLRAKVVHFHDPELIFLGFFMKMFGKYVVFDNHELVYHSIQDKTWIKNLFVRKVIQRIYLFFERNSVRYFDAIVLAEDGYIPYFTSNYKKYMDKIFLIRNYPLLDIFKKSPNNKSSNDKIRLIYTGGLSEHRGIKEIIKSLHLIDSPVELMLLGRWENNILEEQCKTLPGWEKVSYLGFVTHDKIPEYLIQCDMAISMLYPIKNYTTSLPVKVFEYMAMSKPVIMSNFDYWKETFSGCALFADPFNPKDIADKIDQLIQNVELRSQLGINGRFLVDNKYSWKSEEITLLQIYFSFFNN